MNTRLIFVRHAESQHRIDGTSGSMRTCRGLTQKGRAQATATAELVASRAPHAAALYASPLPRAQETAAPIASRLGLPVVTEEGLMTWTAPIEADGMPTKDFLAKYAQPGGGTFRAFESVSETWSDLVVRTGKALTAIAQKHAGQTVILVGHNETIMAGFIVLGGLSLMPPFEAASDNASVTIWETDGDPWAFPGPRWTLHGFNIVSGV